MIKNNLLLGFLIISQLCKAQTPPASQTYKGIFVAVGQLRSNSLKALNESLQSLKLPAFETQMLYLKYGYSIVGKQKIYFAANGEFANQSQSNSDYNLRFSFSQVGVAFGYKMFDKNRFTLIPNIGGGIVNAILSVNEKSSGSSGTMNFKDALLQSKTVKNNLLILPQVGASISLIGFYRVGLTNGEEIVENGVLNVERWWPIGFEIGFKYGKDIGEWALVSSKVTNAPAINLSGLFFTIRTGTVIKGKSIKN
jgi:hypothetical protein